MLFKIPSFILEERNSGTGKEVLQRITEDRKCKTDVKAWIAMAKDAYRRWQELFWCGLWDYMDVKHGP